MKPKIEAKATKDCNDHILFVNVEGHEDVVCLEMWLSTSSIKNYNPLRTVLKIKLSGFYKLSQKVIKFYNCKSYPTN